MRNPRYALVLRFKTGPCKDCGVELPPEVMECDHVRGTKGFALSGYQLMRRSVEEVVRELAKCDRRCPNCHRLRHYYAWNPDLGRPTQEQGPIAGLSS